LVETALPYIKLGIKTTKFDRINTAGRGELRKAALLKAGGIQIIGHGHSDPVQDAGMTTLSCHICRIFGG